MRDQRQAGVGVCSRAAVILAALAAGLWAQPAEVTAKELRLDGFQDWAWDETHSRMFVSTGSKILIVEPETVAIEDTLITGGVAETIAISSDGKFLYAGVGEHAKIERFDLGRKVMDLEIPLNSVTGARLAAIAMAVVPGDPQSVLVARSTWPLNSFFPVPEYDLALYESTTQRGEALPGRISSFHELGNGSIHALGIAGIQRFAIGAAGISVSARTPSDLGPVRGSSSGKYLVDSRGVVFDLEALEPLGKTAALPLGTPVAAVGPDAQGTSVLMAEVVGAGNAGLVIHKYSLDTFRRTASGGVNGFNGRLSTARIGGWAWGGDGLLLRAYVDTHGWALYSLHTSGLTPVSDAPPLPFPDATAVRIAIPANDLVFDATRHLVWASVPGTAPGVGNSVVGIDPETGRIAHTIPAGSEPGKLALSADSKRLFKISKGVPVVNMLDLEAKQSAQRFVVTDTEYWKPRSLAVVPDRPDSVAVLRSQGPDFTRIDIRVYDGGTPRAQAFSNRRLDEHFTALYPGESPGTCTPPTRSSTTATDPTEPHASR